MKLNIFLNICLTYEKKLNNVYIHLHVHILFELCYSYKIENIGTFYVGNTVKLHNVFSNLTSINRSYKKVFINFYFNYR